MDNAAAGAFLQSSITLIALTLALIAFMQPQLKKFVQKLSDKFQKYKKEFTKTDDSSEMENIVNKIKRLEDTPYTTEWATVSTLCLLAVIVFTASSLIGKPILQSDDVIFILFFIGVMMPVAAAIALMTEFLAEAKEMMKTERKNVMNGDAHKNVTNVVSSKPTQKENATAEEIGESVAIKPKRLRVPK